MDFEKDFFNEYINKDKISNIYLDEFLNFQKESLKNMESKKDDIYEIIEALKALNSENELALQLLERLEKILY